MSVSFKGQSLKDVFSVCLFSQTVSVSDLDDLLLPLLSNDDYQELLSTYHSHTYIQQWETPKVFFKKKKIAQNCSSKLNEEVISYLVRSGRMDIARQLAAETDLNRFVC